MYIITYNYILTKRERKTKTYQRHTQNISKRYQKTYFYLTQYKSLK